MIGFIYSPPLPLIHQPPKVATLTFSGESGPYAWGALDVTGGDYSVAVSGTSQSSQAVSVIGGRSYAFTAMAVGESGIAGPVLVSGDIAVDIVIGGGGVAPVEGDPYRVAGTVTVEGAPAARRVVVLSGEQGGRKVVGEGVSAADGTFDLEYESAVAEVVVLALDDYGVAFQAETALAEGDVIHPTVPGGYVYRVTVAGTTGTEEPEWTTGQAVQSGSVTFAPERYYRPVASGPLEGELLEP